MMNQEKKFGISEQGEKMPSQIVELSPSDTLDPEVVALYEEGAREKILQEAELAAKEDDEKVSANHPKFSEDPYMATRPNTKRPPIQGSDGARV